MDGGALAVIRDWANGWREAQRNLPENPIAHYLMLARARRNRRIGPLRRMILPLVIGGVWLIGFISITASSGSVPFGNLEEVVIFVATLAYLLYIVTLLQGCFDAVSDASGLLARRSKGERYLNIDDMLAVSQMSDKEVVAGALGVLLPDLLRRVFAGALLHLFVLLAIVSEAFENLFSDEFVQALTFAPLTFSCIAFSGILASILLCLVMICLGRDINNALTGSAAGVIFGSAQALYPLCALPVMAIGMEAEAFGSDYLINPLTVGVVITLLHLLFVWYLLDSAERSTSLRAFYSVATPFFLPVLLVLMLVLSSLGFEFYGSYAGEALVGNIAVELIYAWGSAALLNPLAIPSTICLGVDIDDALGSTVFPLYGYPMFLLLQIALLVLAALHAERAVKLRRQAR